MKIPTLNFQIIFIHLKSLLVFSLFNKFKNETVVLIPKLDSS